MHNSSPKSYCVCASQLPDEILSDHFHQLCQHLLGMFLPLVHHFDELDDVEYIWPDLFYLASSLWPLYHVLYLWNGLLRLCYFLFWYPYQFNCKTQLEKLLGLVYLQWSCDSMVKNTMTIWRRWSVIFPLKIIDISGKTLTFNYVLSNVLEILRSFRTCSFWKSPKMFFLWYSSSLWCIRKVVSSNTPTMIWCRM